MMELKNFDFKQKLNYHPGHILKLQKNERPFPCTLEIDLTNLCNHDCYFCVVSHLRKEHQVSLDTETAKNAISQFRKLGLKGISFTGGGEPLVHKDFYSILLHAKNEGLDTGLMTNGALLDSEKMEELLHNLSWIRISVGAGSRELYQKIQGKDDYDKVIANVIKLSEIQEKLGTETNIGIRMMVDEENLETLPNLAKDISQSSIDYLQIAPDCRDNEYPIFQTKKFHNVIKKVEEFLKEKQISLLLAGFVKDQDKYDCPKKCYAHYFQIALIATGDIVFCKNARDEKNMVIGNIYSDTVEAIWNSKANLTLEQEIIPSRYCDKSGMCKNMQVNVAVEEILYPPKGSSINFVG